MYILALSLMPCNDQYDCNQELTSFEIKDSDHDTHHHETENCSPFCYCACCGSIYTYNSLPIYIPILKLVLSSDLCEYKNGYIQNIYFNIWQPPKIS
ncbi:MAG: hypothetical protein IPG55_16015 [Saprospiraceae bacterium]|nr:hypothetical protein [Candidatus Defluviibacterium haderslevense]MBK7242518.1 hypothetical protein [Candidatus Defluviibacterium haderslevense]